MPPPASSARGWRWRTERRRHRSVHNRVVTSFGTTRAPPRPGRRSWPWPPRGRCWPRPSRASASLPPAARSPITRPAGCPARPWSTRCPTVASIARVEAETFSNVSSIELTLADWVRLSKRVNDVIAAAAVAGVVVTGGSDTLEELAWWLDLTVGGDRAVVVTGAMRRPSDAHADGPRNLADAVRVAVDPARASEARWWSWAGGCCARATPSSSPSPRSTRLAPPADGPIGRVNGGRVTMTAPRRSPSRQPVFDVVSSTQLPRVDVLFTYQQAPGDLVDAAARAGARGLVIAAAGTAPCRSRKPTPRRRASRGHPRRRQLARGAWGA